MSDIWRCGVCETVNQGGRLCRACGAELTRGAALARSAQGMFAPPLPPARTTEPLPEPVRRSINREPVPEEEWEEYDPGNRTIFVPTPFGCLFASVPRRPPSF